MAPAAVVLAVGAVFAVLGVLTGRELATREYRIAEDEPTGLPHSGWWTGPLAGLVAGYLTWRIGGLAQWAALPAYLLLAWLAGPLIWIDRDVHRLPIGLVRPSGVAVAVLLAVASVADGTDRWRGALIGAAAAFAIYGILWLLPGGIGYGDVRLAPVLGALLGWLGITPSSLVSLPASSSAASRRCSCCSPGGPAPRPVSRSDPPCSSAPCWPSGRHPGSRPGSSAAEIPMGGSQPCCAG